MSSYLLTYVIVILAPPENSSMLYGHIHRKTDNDYIQVKLHLLTPRSHEHAYSVWLGSTRLGSLKESV